MTPITSKNNPTLKHVHALLTQAKARKKHSKTVLEGVHLLEARQKVGGSFEQILVSETAHQHPEIQALLAQISQKPIIIADNLYKQIRTLGDGLDVMASIAIPKLTLGDIYQDCLIVNGVQDNGNLGTLLRTAAAVGVRTVVCTQGTASAWSPKTLRAGMGANFSLTIYEHISIDSVLQAIKVPMFATSSHTQNIIYHSDLTQPFALIMGHEGQGVDKRLLQVATPICLPQPNGQESLNVAIAGSLCLYEMVRQRGYA